MSFYNWHSQMNAHQTMIHILLHGHNIVNLLIMMNIEIRFTYHVSR
jgi:hypothetical protein